MTVRQLVTGHDDNGNAIFLSDDNIQPTEVQIMPGFKTFELWSTEGERSVPHQGEFPGVPRYFPTLQGSVFRLISFPPTNDAELDLDTNDKNLAEVSEKLPGLIEHLELDAPGMHTTDSVDYGMVLKGEIYLELDGGVERLLTAGDCVVQNGTRHAWHNRSSEPAIMTFVLLGASRKTS